MPGILQGILQNNVKGVGQERLSGMGCGLRMSGTLMSRGAVAWAVGMAGGLDFFIDAYPRTARWWGTQDAKFGFIEDPASMGIVDKAASERSRRDALFERERAF